MGEIKHEDVRGYDLSNDRQDLTICTDCITKEEEKELTEEEVLTQEDFEKSENLMFCDRCKEKIW